MLCLILNIYSDKKSWGFNGKFGKRCENTDFNCDITQLFLDFKE